jgi:hypothetical protein
MKMSLLLSKGAMGWNYNWSQQNMNELTLLEMFALLEK